MDSYSPFYVMIVTVLSAPDLESALCFILFVLMIDDISLSVYIWSF